jgi:hypothetical protein
MTRNEKTSKRIAGIAGAVLRAPVAASQILRVAAKEGGQFVMPWRNIRALATSALTQTPNKRAGKMVPYAGMSPALRKKIKALVAASTDRNRFGFSHWGNPPGEEPGPVRKIAAFSVFAKELSKKPRKRRVRRK